MFNPDFKISIKEWHEKTPEVEYDGAVKSDP